uniref:Uncharacterized protein n=1 Tax=Myoviridae sp. ctwwN25 TaxID=2825209 RepID=A0A8S5PQA1_9CAUD|nr:MAG TPA: hypothetical protein [Myoviridae sp. ctwwN25]
MITNVLNVFHNFILLYFFFAIILIPPFSHQILYSQNIRLLQKKKRELV